MFRRFPVLKKPATYERIVINAERLIKLTNMDCLSPTGWVPGLHWDSAQCKELSDNTKKKNRRQIPLLKQLQPHWGKPKTTLWVLTKNNQTSLTELLIHALCTESLIMNTVVQALPIYVQYDVQLGPLDAQVLKEVFERGGKQEKATRCLATEAAHALTGERERNIWDFPGDPNCRVLFEVLFYLQLILVPE